MTSSREQENLSGLTFNIIRGYKLILWAERLSFQPEFTEQLDKFGMNYVEEIEQVAPNAYTVIVLAKLKNRMTPFSILFTCNEEQLKSLVEKVQLRGEYEENS